MITIPEEIKVRFAARKERHPTKVVWVMFDNEHWYVYAQSRRVADNHIRSCLELGFRVFIEIAP